MAIWGLMIAAGMACFVLGWCAADWAVREGDKLMQEGEKGIEIGRRA